MLAGVDIDHARRYLRGSAAARSRMRRNAVAAAWSAIDGPSWRRRGRTVRWAGLVRGTQPFVLAAGRESYVVRVGDEHIGRTVYRTGEYELHKLTRALAVLGTGRVGTLLDVGANIGTTCIPAVSRGLASAAIAIEPEPVNFALLAANVRLNGLQASVTCVHAAAGAVRGRAVELELASSNFGDHRVASPWGPRSDRLGSVTVPSVTLDDVAPPMTGTQDLIWMDVQGYELQVLRGASALLTEGVPVVMEFWPAALAEHHSAAEIREWMGSLSSVVDLGSRSLDPLDAAGIDRLLSELSRDGTQTDLLVRACG